MVKVELVCLTFEFSRTANRLRLTKSPFCSLEEASDAGLFLKGVLVECTPVNRKRSSIN